MPAVQGMSHRTWSVRYYFCEADRPIWRISNVFHEELATGKRKVPDWAGTKQRLLEVYFRNTAQGPIIRDARGSYYRFGKRGELNVHSAVEAISDIAEGTTPIRMGNIIDISATLRQRRWIAEERWQPPPSLLKAVKADLRPGSGRVPVLMASRRRKR
jgi:hypothetical protein